MADTIAEVHHLDPKQTLKLFSQAWSRGDIDGLMALMTEDAIYRSSGGAEYLGHAAIRDAFAAICHPPTETPPEDTPPARIMFFDMHCLSFWSLDLGDGRVEGVDLITFDTRGLITSKDAYRKAGGST